MHGLAWHLPDQVWDEQECTGDVKWDVFQLYRKHWTDDQNVVAFKGRLLEHDLLTELKIPWLDLEMLGCPQFKDMQQLSTVKSCGYHRDPWHHHCCRVECYHFANWVRNRQGLRQDLNIVNVERTLLFLRL